MTDLQTTPADPGATRAPARPTGVLRRMTRQPLTVVAAGFVLLLATVAVLAPVLAPYDPVATDFVALLEGPSSDHLLGTDQLGRDTLSRLIYGSQIALLVAFGAVGVAMLIGVPYGLLLGFRGGWSDRLGSRALDLADALPGMLVGFVVIAILGRGLGVLMLAIGLIFCGSFARITRAVTLAEREKLYVEAAHVAGLRTREILFRQVLPNLAGALVVQAAVFMGSAIIIESALSFLGLGLDANDPSWGSILSVAADEQARQPFLAFPPGLAIIATVLAFNLVGDGLNEVLAGGKRASGIRGSRRRTSRAPLMQVNEPPAGDPAPPRGLLEVRNVTVALDRPGQPSVPLVEDVSLSVDSSEVVGLMGESGSGKSMFARATLGLLPPSTRLASGSIRLDGREIAGLSAKDLRSVRGTGMGVVFQDPMSALSPVHTIGRQLGEPLRAHFGLKGPAARERAAELLDRVGVDDPRRRLNDYPHQLSGGMVQRVAIAMALAAQPKLLIADEATSALDVTTQSQVLDLLLDLRDEFEMALLLITHDLGVVAETCDRAAVMYAGQIVEVGEVKSLFEHPQHPYTAALLAANPSGDVEGRLPTIRGGVPQAGDWPPGCHFANRCAYTLDKCTAQPVTFTENVRCLRADELTLAGADS